MPSPREPPQAPINFVKLAMGPLTVYEGRFDRKGATGRRSQRRRRMEAALGMRIAEAASVYSIRPSRRLRRI